MYLTAIKRRKKKQQTYRFQNNHHCATRSGSAYQQSNPIKIIYIALAAPLPYVCLFSTIWIPHLGRNDSPNRRGPHAISSGAAKVAGNYAHDQQGNRVHSTHTQLSNRKPSNDRPKRVHKGHIVVEQCRWVLSLMPRPCPLVSTPTSFSERTVS